jgi:putative acyl-CoA dehydrogenase
MLSYLWNQGENGICCPLGMTYSAVPALRLQPELAAVWEPFILSTRYDPKAGPMQGKTGGTVGMTLTEKQAGSDLRATQTTARPAAARRGPGEAYRIDGHKWFFSVPHATSSSPWRTPIAASAASCCPAGCPTARATAC